MTNGTRTTFADKWIVSRLANDKDEHGENAGKVIITTEDGEQEICGVVYDEAHARLMARAPQLLAALKALRVAVIQGGDVAFSWPNVYAGVVIDQAEDLI